MLGAADIPLRPPSEVVEARDTPEGNPSSTDKHHLQPWSVCILVHGGGGDGEVLIKRNLKFICFKHLLL